MSLREYRHKRNFSVTSEPRGSNKTMGEAPIFVVQLHHARARHYDFRLQVGDVLKSWAVPKGPSFDPTVKRLAVEVEDHPLGYATFEGDIPAGQYGAGHVEIFDHGTWSPLAGDKKTDEKHGTAAAKQLVAEQLKKGHLQFELNGKRLHGSWHLIRTHRNQRQPQWMLFKAHDRFAGKVTADDLLSDNDKAKTKTSSKIATKQLRSTKTSASKQTHTTKQSKRNWAQLALRIESARKQKIVAGAFAPQLAHSVATAPAGIDWLHETKWDGYRLLTTIRNGKVALWSRNALQWTKRVPDIVDALAELKLASAQFDGELIALHSGKSSFNELQAVLAGESDAPLMYVIFDMPYLDGVSLRACSVLARKDLLRQVLRTTDTASLLFSEHHIGDGQHVFAVASQQGLEGIVSKQIVATYHAGRSDAWVKVKCVLSDEFAIVGYTQPRGSRQGIGALLLARPAAHRTWELVGRTGSGFSNVLLQKLGDTLPKLRVAKPPVTARSLINRDIGKATWIKPRHVAEVYYRGFGKEGLLRQASLKSLREDKSADELRLAPDTPVPATKKSTKNTSQSSVAKSRARKTSPLNKASPALDYLTHPERVVYPYDGITKRQVAEYYELVMPWLLPHIVNRPLSLLRCPNNVKQCFFQKHHGRQFGTHVHTVNLRNSEGGMENYMYVEDADGVRNLVQMNVLEFHPWGSTIADVEHADLITFDLDPAPRVAWQRVIEAAELLRDLLADIQLQSFVKTSGGKGLHVVVPLHPAQPWSSVKPACKQIASAIATARPNEFIATASKAQRTGKIFIDYLRNGRGSTSVAAYSLRARRGAPLAMPLKWSELRHTQGGDDYTLDNVKQHLRDRKQDPWRDIAAVTQQIKV